MNKLSAKHYETFPNNTAFLLLHQGLHEEGEQMLVETTRRAGADRYILGNLALCKALRAEFGEANLLFKAAEFVGGNEHSMAVLNLNIALCFYMQGDLRAGDEFLARALRGSREEICRYLEYSKVVEELRSRSNELDRHVSRILNSVEEEKKPASGAPARDYPV